MSFTDKIKFATFLTTLAITAPYEGAGAQSSDKIKIGETDFIRVLDAGFVVVAYNDEAFGLSIDNQIFSQSADGQEVSRPILDSDLQAACRTVLQRPEARVGRQPPDFIFFQTTVGETGFSLLRLSETETVYFETRSNRCKPIDGPPEEVK